MKTTLSSLLKFLILVGAMSFFATPDAASMELSKNRIRVGFAGYPISNLFYIGFDEYSEAVSSLVLEPLIRLNPEDLSPEPALARSFSVNSTGTSFEFEIHPKATFSDGIPVTEEDVIFTWEAIHKPENRAQASASVFDRIESCKSLSPRRILFKAKAPIQEGVSLFENFYVLPRHFFSKKIFYRDFNESFIGSGPYLFDSVDWGKSIYLKKNPLYWGRNELQNKDRYFLEHIEFQVQNDPSLSLKMLINNELDYLYFLSAKSWEKDTRGILFEKGAIKKMEVRNLNPFAMAGIAWNMRKPLFAKKEIRKALSLLFNRKRLIEDLFYNQYVPSTGLASANSIFHHPDNHPLPYDPQTAVAILKKEGWTQNEKGLLQKNDAPFSFEILTGNPPAAKYLTLYQEDLRKVGIEAKIRVVDWASYLRLRGQGQFDAIDFSRNRNFQMNDLDTTWRSDGASDPLSGNVTGFSNKAVDQLLTVLHSKLPEKERIKAIRTLDKLIADEYPITFSWEPAYMRIAYWNKYDFKKPGYFPYSRWSQIFLHWKWDPEKEKQVQSLSKTGENH